MQKNSNLEEGWVVEATGKIAKIQIERKTFCDACRVCKMWPSNVMVAEAENLAGAKAGERVEVEIACPHYLKSAFMLYIFPLIGLVLGYIVGERVASSELLSICLGIGGVILCFTITCWYDKRLRGRGKLKCKISRVIT
ncbi:hypothetical protein ES707_22526 [subsurface metagenome]